MPIIDVDLPEGVIPTARREQLAHDLGRALLAAEGLPARGSILASMTVYLHAAGSLDADAQGQVVRDITRIVAEAAEDPSLTGRTFVLHSEVAEGGWGARGTAMGRADFDRLNAVLRE